MIVHDQLDMAWAILRRRYPEWKRRDDKSGGIWKPQWKQVFQKRGCSPNSVLEAIRILSRRPEMPKLGDIIHLATECDSR